MGTISIFSLALPVILVFALRLEKNKHFLALAATYLVTLSFNVISMGLFNTNENFTRLLGVTSNFLEFPLMFIFLSYFSFSAILAKRMWYLVLAFLLFEVIITAIYGYNKVAMTIVMAPGLALMMFFSVWFTLRQIRIATAHRKAAGKAVMISSQLFAYGCFSIIYVMFYLLKSKEVGDIFTIYFISTTLSNLALSVGIYIENKRIKKLDELRTTRKELNIIYDKSRPVKTISLGPSEMDKEIWD